MNNKRHSHHSGHSKNFRITVPGKGGGQRPNIFFVSPLLALPNFLLGFLGCPSSISDVHADLLPETLLEDRN